jgi:hypothetical protein
MNHCQETRERLCEEERAYINRQVTVFLLQRIRLRFSKYLFVFTTSWLPHNSLLLNLQTYIYYFSLLGKRYIFNFTSKFFT